MSKIVWQRIDVTCRNASHFKKALDLDLSPCALWVLVWPARHVITLLTQISGFVHRALDGFSIGWKIWRVAWFTLNSSLFSYSRTGWILTFVRGLTIGPCAERYLFTQIKLRRLPADLPRIHATTPVVEKLRRSWCSRTASVKFSTVSA